MGLGDASGRYVAESSTAGSGGLTGTSRMQVTFLRSTSTKYSQRILLPIRDRKHGGNGASRSSAVWPACEPSGILRRATAAGFLRTGLSQLFEAFDRPVTA